MANRRTFVAGGALLAAAVLSVFVAPRRMLAKELPPLRLAADIPQQFAGWRIDEAIVPILPSPDVQEQLDNVYTQILSRTYVNGDAQRIMLTVAYGEDQADRTTIAHLPEACYPAQGFAIAPRPSRPVTIGETAFPVVRLVAQRDPRIEPITYWTVVGEQAFHSGAQRRLAIVRSALAGIIADGMLVRVSSIDTEEPRAFQAQDRFIADLCGALTAAVRPRVFGKLT